MLETVPTYFQVIWEDFTVKDQTTYDTQIDMTLINGSENAELFALNYSRYNGSTGFGYGESTFDRGCTEQEAYEAWILNFNKKQREFKNQIKNLITTTMSQNMYDALLLTYYTTGNFLQITASEGIYDTKTVIKNKDIDQLANMISRSKINPDKCKAIAKILRLVDYGKTKTRGWLRLDGIYKIRTNNELGLLDSQQLKYARFAYFAETLKFLPFTPDGLKREISKQYSATLVNQSFTADGTVVEFDLLKTPAMEPVEKLLVKINGEIVQHLFDYTLDGPKLTITKTLVANDIISTQIKI